MISELDVQKWMAHRACPSGHRIPMVVSQREPGHLTDHTTLSPFDAGERDAFDEGPLGEREDDYHGQNRHRIARHGQIPKGTVSIEEVGQTQGDALLFQRREIIQRNARRDRLLKKLRILCFITVRSDQIKSKVLSPSNYTESPLFATLFRISVVALFTRAQRRARRHSQQQTNRVGPRLAHRDRLVTRSIVRCVRCSGGLRAW